MKFRRATHLGICCRTAMEARAALALVETRVGVNGLTLNPDKTRVGDCSQPGQGFEFPGYRFEAGQRRVRQKSLTALKDRIRARTGRSRGDSLGRIVADLNPMLRGWFEYFKHARPALTVFRMIDKMIRRRLRAVPRKQDRRPGVGRAKADHLTWPNAFFAERGLSP